MNVFPKKLHHSDIILHVPNCIILGWCKPNFENSAKIEKMTYSKTKITKDAKFS